MGRGGRQSDLSVWGHVQAGAPIRQAPEGACALLLMRATIKCMERNGMVLGQVIVDAIEIGMAITDPLTSV
jgi:hypothetical protein